MQIPNSEDEISTASLSEAEEKTIKAVCEQMKVSGCFYFDHAISGWYLWNFPHSNFHTAQNLPREWLTLEFDLVLYALEMGLFFGSFQCEGPNPVPTGLVLNLTYKL